MDLGLKGKRVLITGGTKSIGRAIVDAFVAEGAVVGFCARDAKLVKQREEEWQGQAGARLGRRARRHRRSGAQEMDRRLRGRGRHRPFRRQCERARHRQHARRLAQERSRSTSSRPSNRCVMPCRISKTRPGRDLHHHRHGVAGRGRPGPVQPYRSVKAALVPMVKSLAIEMAPKGVRVNMVSPGSILEDGNTWGRQRDAGSRTLQAHAGAQSDGPHGHAAGSRGLRRLPRRHAGVVRERRQLHRRRRAHHAGAVLSRCAAHALGAGRPPGRGRHRGGLPRRQGAAGPALDPRRARRQPAPGRLAAVDGQPHHGARRHGDRAHRRPLRPSPAGHPRHGALPRRRACSAAFAAASRPCWSAASSRAWASSPSSSPSRRLLLRIATARRPAPGHGAVDAPTCRPAPAR